MAFQEKLDIAIAKNNSLLCVNLDPVIAKMPASIAASPQPLFQFCKQIVDQTAEVVCSFKPNSAFFEAQGKEGIEQLKMICDYIQNRFSEVPIILDAKRGDIGNTNLGYITYAFDYLKVDALTLSPYMGYQSLTPFFELTDKGFFVLCKTSNKGAEELQDVQVEGRPLYLYLAEKIAMGWNTNGNVMLVVGATYPDDLAKIRQTISDVTILVPGVGAQGGDLQAVLDCGLNRAKKGLIIAAGRSIIYADSPKSEAEKMRDEINKHRARE